MVDIITLARFDQLVYKEPSSHGFEASLLGRITMAERWRNETWTKDMWWSGKVTRRRLLGFGAAAAGALGAILLVPAPWREAFGQSKPYKIGTLQPLSGTAASGGKTALIGTQMAVERINKAGGINGRMVE